MFRCWLAVGSLGLLLACGEIDEGIYDNEVDRIEQQTDKSHSRPRVASQFNAQSVISDAFYGDTDSLSEAGIQQFLENSPYGRSWLADASTGGSRVSSVVKQLSTRFQVNPILLLSRMQVESSLVSATSRPSNHRVDYAMGCGCHDGTNCAYAPRGLGPQLECAAEKFRGLYEKSADGSGWWRKGLPKDTLDYYRIVPKSHATAALYAYTPWVLPGSGGTWLAWSIARQFDRHVADWNLSSDGPASSTGHVDEASVSPNPNVYTVESGGTCWEADSVLGCNEGVVVCNVSRTCQSLQVGDRIACSLDACSGGGSTGTSQTTTREPNEEVAERDSNECSQFTVPDGGTCWDAAQELGCSEGSIVNCTEPTATCGTMWAGDVLACNRNCCGW